MVHEPAVLILATGFDFREKDRACFGSIPGRSESDFAVSILPFHCTMKES